MDEISDHDRCIQILQALHNLLAEIPATLPVHQERVASIQFVANRLIALNSEEEE